MLISSRENSDIKRLVRLQKQRDERERERIFVCEGQMMLAEAVASGLMPEKLFVLQGQEANLPTSITCPVFSITPGVLEKISDTKSPRGPVFTCRMPDEKPVRGEKLIGLDNLSDPGNMGTVLRAAEAFGVDGVVLLGSCADIFSPKTVRSAMGSLFRVNVYSSSALQLSEYAASAGLKLYAACLDGKVEDIRAVSLKRACVIIGSEAHGVSRDVRDICDAGLIIPISGAQSLNAAVAAAVVMWEMAR